MPAADPFARARETHGFLTAAQLVNVAASNDVLDASSLLVSRFAVLGDGNIFYPGVVLECDAHSTLALGSRNVFYPGAFLSASHGGAIRLGNDGTYGPGGVQILAHGAGNAVVLGSQLRLNRGAEVSGDSELGDGCQVLGPIQARSVHLAAGRSFEHDDPDERGGVLKGFGVARGARVGVGEVLNGAGDFALASIERQLSYHPRASRPL